MEVHDTNVAYVRAQFDQAIKELEKLTGKKFDQEKFDQACANANRTASAWLRVCDYLQYKPAPYSGFDLFNHMADVVTARGKEAAADAFALLAEDLEKNGDKDSAGQYRAQAKTLEDAAKDMDKQIRSAQGSQASMSLRRIEDTVLWTAQNLMGTYNTLKAEQDAALAQAEWKQSQYEKLLRQVQTGSASAAQADQAGKEADAAAAKAKAVQDEMERVKKELFILTGYPEGSQAEVGPMPAPGLSVSWKWEAARQMARAGQQLFP